MLSYLGRFIEALYLQARCIAAHDIGKWITGVYPAVRAVNQAVVTFYVNYISVPTLHSSARRLRVT